MENRFKGACSDTTLLQTRVGPKPKRAKTQNPNQNKKALLGKTQNPKQNKKWPNILCKTYILRIFFLEFNDTRLKSSFSFEIDRIDEQKIVVMLKLINIRYIYTLICRYFVVDHPILFYVRFKIDIRHFLLSFRH